MNLFFALYFKVSYFSPHCYCQSFVTLPYAVQAFGVGALEDEDEDVYSVAPMSNYDFELNDDKPTDKNYGWTAPQHHSSNVVPIIDTLYFG